MKTYNQDKTQIIENPNLELGYLKRDVKVLRLVPAQEEVEEKFHYEVIKEYPNGGKELRKVVDVEYQPAVEEHEEKEDIYVYIPYTAAELLQKQMEELREWRKQYFAIIDCAVWYDTLTQAEKEEVKAFRLQLLDITRTLVKPSIPVCVSNRIK